MRFAQFTIEVDDPCLGSYRVEARNFFLACYLASLAQGDTILGGAIRYTTMKQYLKAACKLFKDRKLSTYAHDSPDFVRIILDAVKNYEKVPNRRNMITDEMMIWLLSQSTNPSTSDDATTAIVDWIILGRYTGFRKSEWCQSTLTKFEKITEWPGHPALAFVATDFVLMGPGQQRITITSDTTYTKIIQLVEFVEIQWRKQKNNDNGQKIPFARDHANPTTCPVLAAVRIIIRASRLGVASDTPIGVFNHKGQTRFITDTKVQHLLRTAAKTTMGISDEKEILKWSTHSIRVTAANLLHREKFSDSFIQNRLRWKSQSFLMYLRNTIYSASAHTKSLALSNSNLPPLAERSYREPEPHESLLPQPNA